MFPRFDIAIGKLHVHASAQDAVRVASDLRDGGWSVEEDTAWVFIRSLAVTAPPHQLRQDVSREIRSTLQQAVDGNSQRAANADVVRFPTLAAMLACLLRDLLECRSRVWYWHQWRHLFTLPPAQAATELLWEHMQHVAAVLERLSALHVLPVLWAALTPGQAELLLARLANLQQVPVQRLLQAPFVDEHMLAPQQRDIAGQFFTQDEVLAAWRRALGGGVPSGPRLRLAAAAAALTVMPQALAQRPEDVIAAFRYCLYGTSVTEAGSQTPVAEESVPGVGRSAAQRVQPALASAAPANDVGLRVADDPVRKAAVSAVSSVPPEMAVASRDTSPDLRGQRARQQQILRDDGMHSAPQPHHGDERGDIVRSSLHARPDGTQDFIWQYQGQTRLGGVFYLINAINHPASYALLRAHQDWDSLLSGWTLIHRLAMALGATPDESLQRFFVAASGLQSVAQLDGFRHDALVALLMPALKARHARLLEDAASLFHVPARIQMDYSHVAVTYDMSAIRLPVRLGGLDVDPGWLPWLGRVVRFHYRDDATLRCEVQGD